MLAPLPPGTPRRIGPHTLLARIGAGGMGEVFLARRDGRGGPALVALKVIRQDLDIDDAFRTRFRREIAAARAVTGPFTAALVAADADAERPWLATEYIPGPSLADVVERRGPLPAPAVRALGAALARALGAVHGARVLHRDLKPGNVLLAPDGPRLIDFGIAHAFEATALTLTGVVVGTPGFLAPEQIEGSHAVVPASDVFSLGAVLCHAATGRGPFDDPEPASVVFRVVRGDADLSGVPAELLDTIAACLRPAPDHRPTPAALAAALSGPDGGTPAVAWPADVLSLFAAYREAAAGFERAHDQVGFADAATAPGGGPRLRAEPSPTLGAASAPPPGVPTPPGAPPRAVPPRRGRRRVWVAAAALATAGLAVAAVTLPDALRDRQDDGPPGKSPSAPGAPADRVVSAYGNRDHSGEFGPSAADRAARPEGWRFWSRQRPGGPGGMDGKGKGCVLAGATLVCRDGRGAARAVDAATGDDRWSTPGFPGEPVGIQELPPEADAERVYVPSELGVSALGRARGEVVWRHRTPRNTALVSMTYAQGVVYTGELHTGGAPDDPHTTTVRARSAATGDQLWRTTITAKPRGTPLVRGGRWYLALENGGIIALSAHSGERSARVREPGCDGLFGHGDAVGCWSRAAGGVKVLDPGTLAVRRTVGTRRPAAPPVVGTADVLVIAHTDRAARLPDRLTAYAWRSGRKLWDLPAGGEPSTLALSGDRVFAVSSYDVRGVPLSGDARDVTRRTIPYAGVDTGPKSLYAPLFLGGTVYAESGKGLLVSGRIV